MPARGRPRYRYVAFRLEPPGALSRAQMIQRVQAAAHASGLEDAQPWLTRFDGEYGILRVHHRAQREAARMLGALSGPFRVTTLGASGTIRALVRRHLPHGVEEGGNKWRAQKRRQARRVSPEPARRAVVAERVG